MDRHEIIKYLSDDEYTIEKLDWQIVGIILKHWRKWLPGVPKSERSYVGAAEVTAGKTGFNKLGAAVRLSVEFTNNFVILKIGVQPDNADAPLPLTIATVPYKQIINEVTDGMLAEGKGYDLAMKMRSDIDDILTFKDS